MIFPHVVIGLVFHASSDYLVKVAHAGMGNATHVTQVQGPQTWAYIAGGRSSISIEDEFWNGLKDIAKARHETVTNLINSINAKRKHANLWSAIRLYVFDYYKAKSVCVTSSGTKTYLTLMWICRDFAGEPQNGVIRDKLIELSRIWTEAALPSPYVAKIGHRTRH